MNRSTFCKFEVEYLAPENGVSLYFGVLKDNGSLYETSKNCYSFLKLVKNINPQFQILVSTVRSGYSGQLPSGPPTVRIGWAGQGTERVLDQSFRQTGHSPHIQCQIWRKGGQSYNLLWLDPFRSNLKMEQILLGSAHTMYGKRNTE